MEQFPGNSEKAPINRQEVINRIKEYGIQDHLYVEWNEQVRNTREGTTQKEIAITDLKNEITILKVLMEAERYEDVYYNIYGEDGLPGLYETAMMVGEEDLKEEINELFQEANKKLDELE